MLGDLLDRVFPSQRPALIHRTPDVLPRSFSFNIGGTSNYTPEKHCTGTQNRMVAGAGLLPLESCCCWYWLSWVPMRGSAVPHSIY